MKQIQTDIVGENEVYYTILNGKAIIENDFNKIMKKVTQQGMKLTRNKEAFKLLGKYNIKHIPYNLTTYNEIHKLRPAHRLEEINNRIYEIQYWKPDWTKKSDPLDYEKVITKSAQKLTKGKKKIAILLSGGADSTTMAILLKDKKPMTYTIGKGDNDPDFLRAKKVADKLGLENKRVSFNMTEKEMNKLGDELFKKYIGMPCLNRKATVLMYLLCEQAKRDGYNTIITGNGGDELFYGYDGTKWLKMLGKFPNFKNLIYGDIAREISKQCNSPYLIDKAYWLGFVLENEHCANIPVQVVKKALGVEVLNPLETREVIEYACGLPIKFKTNSMENKHIMKEFIRRKLGNEFVVSKTGFGYGIR